jgi:hypothetical protein
MPLLTITARPAGTVPLKPAEPIMSKPSARTWPVNPSAATEIVPSLYKVSSLEFSCGAADGDRTNEPHCAPFLPYSTSPRLTNDVFESAGLLMRHSFEPYDAS